MSLSLINLVILIGLFAGGYVVGALLSIYVVSIDGIFLSVGTGIIAVLFLTWPIHKKFHFRPFCFPKCDKCKKIPKGYYFGEAHWPKVVLECIECKQRIEIWMMRKIQKEEISKDLSVYVLKWPEFIGRWKRIK